jgi:hypothetical protein
MQNTPMTQLAGESDQQAMTQRTAPADLPPVASGAISALQSTLDREVAAAIEATGCNSRTAALMLEAWTQFREYVSITGPMPGRLDEVSTAQLRGFVEHLRSAQPELTAIHLVLATLRMLLLSAGHAPGDLNALTVPVRRLRVTNADGKYRYEDRVAEPRCEPHASSDSASGRESGCTPSLF